jgi:iron complex outermembrane receptor protein
MRFFTTLFLLSLLTISIFAQQNGGRIEGKIVQNTRSIASAKVLEETIRNKTISLMAKIDNKIIAETKTDNDGKFIFESVQSGNYWIFVDCNYCWRNSFREEISVNAGQTLNLKIELPKFMIFEKVEVSAGTSQPFDEISKSVSVIDSKELRERSESFLGDSLRNVPAFRIQQSGGFGRFTSIKIRGLRNQDTAILLDGMRFRDASAISGDASSFISDFTHTNAFRMEILRGSGSSLYGTNAIGGVVDVQTQAPRKGFHGGLTTAIGSLGQKRIRGNVSDGFDKFGYTFGVSRTIFSKGIDGNDDAHNTNFNGRFDFTPTQKTQFSGRFFVSDAFVKLNSSPDTFGTLPTNTATIIDAKRGVNFVVDADDPDANQKSNAFNGQIRFTHFFKDNLWLSSNYQGSRTQRRNSDGLLGVGFQSEYDSIFGGQIHTLENKLNWQTERNFLTVGYEYEWERFLNRGVSKVAIENFQTVAKQSSNTFYAQDLLNFFKRKLQFSGSFRTQFFNLQTPTFSATSPFQNVTITNPPNSYTFDGSASYFVEKTQTKIRFHAGNGYRVPSLYERFGSFYSTFFGAGFTRLGNPNLKPEKSFAFDFGIDQILTNNRVKLSATAFYTKITDTMYFLSTDDIGRNSYINLSNAFSRGAEFSAEIKPFSTTNIFASYTFTNSDQRAFTNDFFPPINLRSVDQKSFGIPDHQFSIVATQYISKRFFVNFDFLATSNYLAPIFSNSTFRTYTYRFGGNRKADISTSYEIPSFKEKLKWRLFGTVENIFGYEYFENGFQTAGRTFKAGLSVSF